ncbi:right-handed parallel beta-helix repeat-containing protein [bacterium]|nr:right-handed parallel beta-helix repeat-containing protein [bacterium]
MLRCRRFSVLFLLIMCMPLAVYASNGKIPIYQPTVITASGSYYLTADLPPASPAIIIDADFVTLDLDGHTVNGTIQLMNSHQNIRVTNGEIGSGGNLDFSIGGNHLRVDNLQIAKGMIYIGPGRQNVVEHNTASRIMFAQVRNGQIVHNLLTEIEETAVGIDLMECENIEVMYNNSHGFVGEGIHLGFTTDCIVSYNDVCHQSNNGLIMDDSNNNQIMHNNFSNNGMCGIQAFHSNNNLIAYNVCSANDSEEQGNGNGIRLELCDANDVSNNTVSGNEVNGIMVSVSTNNRIAHNNCSSNVQIGINLINNALNNSLDWNHTANNGIGISFDATTLGNIYANNRAPGSLLVNYQDLGANLPVVYGAGFPTNF